MNLQLRHALRAGGVKRFPKTMLFITPIVAILNEPMTIRAWNKRYSLIIIRTIGVANRESGFLSRVICPGARVICRGSRVKSRESRVKSHESRVKSRGSNKKSRVFLKARFYLKMFCLVSFLKANFLFLVAAMLKSTR